jgi:hypothetical protein
VAAMAQRIINTEKDLILTRTDKTIECNENRSKIISNMPN